jgi:hypothetical protein
MSVHVEETPSSVEQPGEHEPQATGASVDGGAPLPRKPLGQLAVDAGLITPQQLASAFADISGGRKRLGEVLVEREWIDEEQLDRLLAYQARLAPAPTEADEHAGDGAVAAGGASDGSAEPARDLDDLVAEVERRAAAVSRRAGRESDLEARLAETETLLQVRDGDLAVAREEIQRLEQQLAERDEHDDAIRATLERVTQQLGDRDGD